MSAVRWCGHNVCILVVVDAHDSAHLAFILFVDDHRITLEEIYMEFSSVLSKENAMIFNIILCRIAR